MLTSSIQLNWIEQRGKTNEIFQEMVSGFVKVVWCRSIGSHSSWRDAEESSCFAGHVFCCRQRNNLSPIQTVEWTQNDSVITIMPLEIGHHKVSPSSRNLLKNSSLLPEKTMVQLSDRSRDLSNSLRDWTPQTEPLETSSLENTDEFVVSEEDNRSFNNHDPDPYQLGLAEIYWSQEPLEKNTRLRRTPTARWRRGGPSLLLLFFLVLLTQYKQQSLSLPLRILSLDYRRGVGGIVKIFNNLLVTG